MRSFGAFIHLALLLVIPQTASAQDASAWSGFFGGVQVSYGSGFQDYGGGGYDLRGESYGLFTGYLWASGPWAVGMELNYANANIDSFDAIALPEYRFNHTFDAKLRAGYAIGPSLVYGTIGYGTSEWQEGSTDPDYLFNAEGVLFGVGIDYLVSDRIFVGGEFIRRNLDNDVDLPFNAQLTSFTLRVGLNF